MNLIEELRWRGMLQDIVPGLEEKLSKEKVAAYVGFDPTADSLHVGHLVSIRLLALLQKHGHKPIALVGGATGMIGDPSGKSDERNLLDQETLARNIAGIQSQLTRFLDFEKTDFSNAELKNNYDWISKFSFIDFARDIGKYITVNYMMSKDSVKKRLSEESRVGMSFTEFTYQLIQGYDFLHLNKTLDCQLQLGGSDQWGNITTGIEMARKMEGKHLYGATCPLITKADGTKFGKTESGAVWLSAQKTSPYKFYQFWLNVSDQDAEKYIKIFTDIEVEEIKTMIEQHLQEPHQRLLQKTLAVELTKTVHGKPELVKAELATSLFFGKSSVEDLSKLTKHEIVDIFEGAGVQSVSRSRLGECGIPVVDLLSEQGVFLKSKGEARRSLKENSIAINKEKVNEHKVITRDDFVNDEYILAQRGKKTYFIYTLEA